VILLELGVWYNVKRLKESSGFSAGYSGSVAPHGTVELSFGDESDQSALSLGGLGEIPGEQTDRMSRTVAHSSYFAYLIGGDDHQFGRLTPPPRFRVVQPRDLSR
jgi:hypothetical protein